MLIHDFVQVARPFEAVSELMLTSPLAMLAAAADAAYRDGEQLTLRMVPSAKHPRIGKRVMVDLGHPYRRHDRLVLPIHWWAVGATALFPRLDADLEVAPLDSQSTQVTLMGAYDPPFAVVGKTLDRLVLHRIAEASVRSFMERLASAMSSDMSPLALVTR